MSVSHTPTDPSATTRAEGKGGSECVSGECVSECSGVQSRVVFGPESDSWCARHAKLVHFTHSWSIEQFTYCYDNDPSTRPLVWSAILSASPREKYRFYLKLYPKGQHEEARDHLSLLLNLCITGSLIVHYKFSIVDADGNKCHTKEDRREFHYYINSNKNSDTWGFERFIERDVLLDPANRLLPDNKLTIYCEISYVTDVSTVSDTVDQRLRLIGPRATESLLLSDLRSLLSEGRLSDVVLVVGSVRKLVPAHRALLAARSPVFAAMFEPHTKEALESRVEMPDIAVQVMDQLLEYIYLGTVTRLDDHFAQELLAAADKYQLDQLKAICEEWLCAKLTPDSVAGYLLLADMHSAARLKARALDYLNCRTSESIQALIKCKPDMVVDLFRQFTLKVTADQTEQDEQDCEASGAQSNQS